MSIIPCIIIDDEPLALDLLESYVLQTPFLQLKAKCSSAIEALQYLEQDRDVELVYVDIQMPDFSGMDFSKVIDSQIKIVFTTAFEQYAVAGYKVNAVGYLLKPYDYAEFLSATNKAKFVIESSVVMQQETPMQPFIFVKSEYKLVKILFEDILYIEGLKDYVKIVLQSQDKPVLSLMSLKKLEEELPESNFMRVHRSFIVALNKIEAIERSHIIIQSERIAIAPQYKDGFDQFMNGKSI